MKKNMNSAATGAVFGLFIALIYFVLQLMNGNEEVTKTLITALGTGAAAGLLFGLYIRSFTKRQAEEFKSVKARLESDGKVFLDAAANHLYNDEYVGGWLFLTDKGLYFLANPMNVLSHSCKVLWEDIAEVRMLKQMGFNNGVVVATAKGIESFSLSKPGLWIKTIEEKIKEA